RHGPLTGPPLGAAAAYARARRLLSSYPDPELLFPWQGLRYASTLARMAALALRRPSLVPSLVSAAWRFRRRYWYRTPPFLPVPPPDYLAWRLHTAYGSED